MSLPIDTVLNCDCMDPERGLPSLPDGCVNAVITDPPFGVDIAPWDVAPTQEFVDECLRVATGPVLMFGSAAMRSMSAFVALEPQRMVAWAPAFTLSALSTNGMRWRWHPIWCWRLPTSQDGLERDITTTNCEGHHWWDHHCTKPVRLMRDLVRFTEPGNLVLDPFLGSGTTAVACIQTGRRFLGYEIDPDYCAIAERRIVEARAQPRLDFDTQSVELPETVAMKL